MIDLDHVTDRLTIALRGAAPLAQVLRVRPDTILAYLGAPVDVGQGSPLSLVLATRIELATDCSVRQARARKGVLRATAAKE